MLILKCTKTVQDYLGIDAAELKSPPLPSAILGAWYVNQFVVDRRKTFIFMSERSYLSFILHGARKANSNKQVFPEMLLAGMVQILKLLEIPMPLIGHVIEDSFTQVYAKTDSRSALGSMNDLVSIYRHSIMYSGGLDACNLHEIIHDINHMPQKNLGFKDAASVTRELLESVPT